MQRTGLRGRKSRAGKFSCLVNLLSASRRKSSARQRFLFFWTLAVCVTILRGNVTGRARKLFGRSDRGFSTKTHCASVQVAYVRSTIANFILRSFSLKKNGTATIRRRTFRGHDFRSRTNGRPPEESLARQFSSPF